MPPQPIMQSIPVVTNPGDLSFERLSPQLPAVFEYNDFKYIDTARVEPRIAYSPEKTPPKTPETPHFGRNPFPRPVTLDDKVIVAQVNTESNKIKFCISTWTQIFFLQGKLASNQFQLKSSSIPTFRNESNVWKTTSSFTTDWKFRTGKSWRKSWLEW